MFSGFQEIGLLVIIALGIFFIPRMMKDKKPPQKILTRKKALSGRMRIALVLSFLWPVAMALYLQPWETGLRLFVILGAGPVIFFWCIKWVVAGFGKSGTYH